MKFKIYKLLSLVILLILSNIHISQAETVGDYFTVKLSQNNIGASASFIRSTGQHIGAGVSRVTVVDPSFSSTNHSIGLEYNKALRFNRFTFFDIPLISKQLDDLFITYGVFYDRLDYNNYVNNRYNVSIKSRYGANIGVGYDLNKSLATYVRYGFSSVDYEIDARSSNLGAGGNGTKNGRAATPILYVGLDYSITQDVLLGFGYSRQKLDLESSTYNTGPTNPASQINERHTLDTEIESFSIKLTQRF